MDVAILQGLEKQPGKLMEEKSTKADLYRVTLVAQGVAELHVEPGKVLSSIYQIFILISGTDNCRQHTGDNRPAI